MSPTSTYALRFVIGLLTLSVAGCGVMRVMTLEPKLASEQKLEREAASNSPAVRASAAVALPPSDSPPAPSEPVREPGPRPESKPPAAAPPPKRQTKVAAAAPAAKKPDTEPQAAPMPDPDKLLGMGEGAILKWLGPPASRRDEPPANVWRYATDSCALEVVFFLDVNDSTRRVLSYDFEVEEGGPETAHSCFKSIEKGHAAVVQDHGSR